jgi:hypothetical protein
MDAKAEIDKLRLAIVAASAACKVAAMQADLLVDRLPVTHPDFFEIADLAERLDQANTMMLPISDWEEILGRRGR